MARVTISQTRSSPKALNIEIAQLCDLDIKELRARWRTLLRREAPPHLPRHLLLWVVAYRLQANAFGDLDDGSQRLLGRATSTKDRSTAPKSVIPTTVQPGTILSREWNDRMHRVAVLADGFAWNGKTYPSLTKVAFAITGARWNGPRFFGLRDKPRPRPGTRA